MNLERDLVVLVTGGSGTLGWVLARELARRCRVTATFCSHPQVPSGATEARLDLESEESIESAFRSARPGLVIHSAAWTDPDVCERAPARAHAINVAGTQRLASLAREAGARMIFVSTDLVFDGSRGGYAESDTPKPLCVYAATKLAAERAVLDADGQNLVVRSSLIYGFAGPASKTFLAKMLDALAQGQRIHLFTDQRRNPVLVDDLARGIILGAERGLSGLYHLGGADRVSRYEFGLEACRVFGRDRSLAVPARMADFAMPAERPLDATLDSSRMARATGFAPHGIREGLELARQGLGAAA